MLKYTKPLRMFARITRVLSLIILALAVWYTIYRISMIINMRQESYTINTLKDPSFYLNQLWNYAVALILWTMSVACFAFAAVIEDLEKMKRVLYGKNDQSVKSDEERYGLPKKRPAQPVNVSANVQTSISAPRMKIENRSKLATRLYGVRWQNKPPRSVKKSDVRLD